MNYDSWKLESPYDREVDSPESEEPVFDIESHCHTIFTCPSSHLRRVENLMTDISKNQINQVLSIDLVEVAPKFFSLIVTTDTYKAYQDVLFECNKFKIAWRDFEFKSEFKSDLW